ncbi:rRNA maturation RNase YbeY [Anabaena sp. FACHB-1237]|nr:rRNA maturation RNase YbeY [Anabaena sp. FACHB-1237]MBD2138922.1 rRNA maturation RNase YbeY [Anabaena sp. FACHB-1237]
MPIELELYLDNLIDNQKQQTITDKTWQEWFNQWLEMLNNDLPPAPSYELSLRLTDDSDIQILNAQYRLIDQPTDVLAFASLETDLPQNEEMRSSLPLYLGDIIISIDTAKRQAQQQGHSLSTELAWLAAHGLLHLLGWDHPDEERLLSMLNQQVTLLKGVSIIIDL